jgi:probable addiction module antidote protein
MAIRTIPFDAAEYIRSPEDQIALLNDALASNNAAYISNALGVIARAKGMTEVARGAGVTREALYKSLDKKGDPKLTTLMGVFKTLNVRLEARPVSPIKVTRRARIGVSTQTGRKKKAHAKADAKA